MLVVDDEPMVLKLTQKILERQGYETLSADSGESAVAVVAAEKDQLNCVLLDLTMPGLSGSELVRRIREEAPSVGMILMSGYSSEQLEGELSALPFLSKPFRGNDLTAVLNAALGVSK